VSSAEHAIRLEYFRQLLVRYMPKTFAILTNIGALGDQFLNMLFVNMFLGLIPEDLQKTMIDAFLCEGWRILLRFSLALFFLFKRDIKSRTVSTGAEFWKLVENRAASEPTLFSGMLQVAYKIPHRNLQWLLKPVVISGTNIREGLQKTIVRKRNSSADLLVFDLEGNTTSSKKHMRDPVKAAKQQVKTEQAIALQQQNPQIVERLVQQSVILGDAEKATYLIATLPASIQLKGLEIVFASRTHGFDLGTLYAKLAHLTECVFVIHTVATEEQPGSIIGAYMATSALPPSKKIKGNGMNYIFSVTNQEKFVWSDPTADSAKMISSEEVAATNQYALFTPEHFSFGASYSKMTNAIKVDEHLRYCVCGVSDTYHNPVLLNGHVVGNEIKAEILELEVYCPVGDLEKAARRK
jgi:hypothetical protein